MSSEQTNSEFKLPPKPELWLKKKVKRSTKVLDEDEYVDAISEIIERDYFPDLKKHREIITRGDGDETPKAAEDNESESSSSSKSIKGGLDKFLSRHTGEDNESFNEIMDRSRNDFIVNNSWMFKSDEQESLAITDESLKLPSIEDQAKAESNTTLQGWKYKNKNPVFYGVDEPLALTREEEIERAKKQREIVIENTRFQDNPWKNNSPSTNTANTTTMLLSKKRNDHSAKVGIDGKELERPNTPSVNGYKFIRMTSPAVDPSQSPLMTWGEIESTPYRLEGSQTPSFHSSKFTIQNVPKRDQIALDLAEKNAKFYRDKKQKAIQRARCNIKTPNIGSMSERVATMSPAAQRLATSKLGVRLGTDKSLKASYTPSPMRKPSNSAANTPTPSSSSLKSAIAGSIRSKTPSRTPDPSSLTDGLLNFSSSSTSLKSTSESLTDNLLNLSKESSLTTSTSEKKRIKASDFF